MLTFVRNIVKYSAARSTNPSKKKSFKVKKKRFGWGAGVCSIDRLPCNLRVILVGGCSVVLRAIFYALALSAL